jgi:hypothetical protein
LSTFDIIFDGRSAKIRGQSFYFKICANKKNGKVPGHDPSARDRPKCLGSGQLREGSLRCGAVGAKGITSLHLAQNESYQVEDIPQFLRAHFMPHYILTQSSGMSVQTLRFCDQLPCDSIQRQHDPHIHCGSRRSRTVQMHGT